MGTRADFYVGRGATAEWLGSIAMDGYPDGEPRDILKCTDEDGWRDSVAQLIASCGHGTTPADGWPWPWEDGHLTDYSYAFDGGKVHASAFGRKWHDPLVQYSDDDRDAWDDLPKEAFPNMSDRSNVTFGKRSGIILLGVR